jgi:protein arginine kinase activator
MRGGSWHRDHRVDAEASVERFSLRSPAAVRQQQADAARCTFCSTTLREFRNSGRLGACTATERSSRACASCSADSRDRQACRGSLRTPAPTLLERSSTLGELRERLRRAVETEQFELAASIRDQIKGLE